MGDNIHHLSTEIKRVIHDISQQNLLSFLRSGQTNVCVFQLSQEGTVRLHLLFECHK